MMRDMKLNLEKRKQERKKALQELNMMQHNVDEFIDFNRAKKIMRMQRRKTFNIERNTGVMSPLI